MTGTCKCEQVGENAGWQSFVSYWLTSFFLLSHVNYVSYFQFFSHTAPVRYCFQIFTLDATCNIFK